LQVATEAGAATALPASLLFLMNDCNLFVLLHCWHSSPIAFLIM